MKSLLLKISVVVIVLFFLGISFSIATSDANQGSDSQGHYSYNSQQIASGLAQNDVSNRALFNAQLQTISSDPVTNNSSVHSGSTLSLQGGKQIYVYGADTGGGFPMSNFSAGQYASVVDQSGEQSAALAYGLNSSDNYSTYSAYYSIGGISVSGYGTMTAYHTSNQSLGAGGASLSITVTDPGSLVVIISLTSSTWTTTSVSGLPNLTVDANISGTPNSVTIPILIAQAYESPGTYNVSEMSAYFGGADPSHVADLLGVFVFTPNTTNKSVGIPPSTELYSIIGGVAVVAIIGYVVAIMRKRR